MKKQELQIDKYLKMQEIKEEKNKILYQKNKQKFYFHLKNIKNIEEKEHKKFRYVAFLKEKSNFLLFFTENKEFETQRKVTKTSNYLIFLNKINEESLAPFIDKNKIEVKIKRQQEGFLLKLVKPKKELLKNE